MGYHYSDPTVATVGFYYFAMLLQFTVCADGQCRNYFISLIAACGAIRKRGKLVFSMFSPRGVRPRRKPVPISVYQKFTLLSTNVKITLPNNQQGDKFAL